MTSVLQQTTAGALLAVASASASAQSVHLNGLVDVYVGSRQLAGAAGKQTVVNNGGLSTSRWGIEAREDLGNGLKAAAVLSGFLRADTGEAGRFGTTDGGFRRFAYVELAKTDIGTLRLGRVGTPTFTSTIRFNPFADSATVAPMVLHQYAGGQPLAAPMNALDSAADNTLAYLSPTMGGFNVQLNVSPGEVAGESNRRRTSVGVFWAGGPAAAGLAAERANTSTGLPTGVSKVSTLHLGSSYDLRVAKLFAQYAKTDHDLATGTRAWKSYQLGASVPVGQGAVLASMARSKKTEPGVNDLTRTTVAVGYDYPFSKRTDAYVVYMNDKLTAATTGNTLIAGIRHRF